MHKGFQPSTDNVKIQIAVKRLTPSAKRNDIHAFANGVREAQIRYGHNVAEEAMTQLFEQFPDLAKQAMKSLPSEMQNLMHEEAVAIIAEVVEDAGLRLEDHIRRGDRGVALTREAIRVIADTDYPDIRQFGEGNVSLAGVGIDRDPFVHHLSEIDFDTEITNSWGFASIVISSAQGWFPDCNREKSRAALADCVSRVAPTVDLDKMLYRARYCDITLSKLASYAERGFQAIADQTFNQ